jgi:uncharacterized protein (TIRG00374 family)
MAEAPPPDESAPTDALPPGPGSRWTDWRIWLGLAITVICVWWASRGIPMSEVVEAMRRADFWPLLLLSAPFYTLSVYVRALRWRHLTNPIAPMSRRTLFRSASLGFMVNNLLPLRLGEVVRSWTLARDTGTSMGAVVGTVVLERILDVASVLALAAASLAYVGSSSDVGGVLAQGSILLAPVAIAPLLALVVMKIAPEWVVRVAHFFLVPLPLHFRDRIERMLRSFIAGLGALRGGSHLFWIVLHSMTIWLLLSAAPIWIGLWAFDVDLGPPVDTLVATWIVLGAVGVAVALPSAPGFIGPYQLAFKSVLVRFGVDPATALAMGVLVWFAFWLTLTLQGLFFLRSSRTSLSELTGHSE